MGNSVMSAQRLKDKVALITGGSAGIGAAIVQRFVAEGGKVLVGDLDYAKGSALCAELGQAAAFQKLDVADAATFAGAIARAIDVWGRLDILVNNAGTA